jgi:protein-S-isoprenylcysteine O-methyltransferase Ste14
MPKVTVRLNSQYLFVLAATVAGAVFGGFGAARPGNLLSHDLVQPLWVSFAIYAAFSIYWTIAASNSAPTKSAEPVWSTALHQSMLTAALFLLFLRIPGLTGRWLPLTPVAAPCGIALEAAAAMLGVWARLHLGKNWSAAITAKVGHQLIRTGPYRLLRHPIYTAMFGIYTGIAIASGEWHAAAGVALLTVAYWRKIRLEEQNLERVFGAEYQDFRTHSWALIPWVI